MEEIKSEYNEQSALNQDDCFTLGQCVRNNRVFEYIMYNNYDPHCKTQQDKRIQNFSLKTQRQMKTSHTPLSCDIDTESTLWRSEISTCPGRTQLNPRPFAAVPDLSKGIPEPDVEATLLQGAAPIGRRACEKDGQSINTFIPLIPCVENWLSQLAYSDTDFQKIGMPTRHEEHQNQFLKEMGYINDNGIWRKNICGKNLEPLVKRNNEAYTPFDQYDLL